MAKRKNILDKLYDIAKNIDSLKVVYQGVAPAWGNVRQFPACAIILDKEVSALQNYACDTRRKMNVLFIIYHKHSNNDYDDILSPVIDSLENAIQTNTDLKDLTVISYVKQITLDGGILHPYAIAEVDLEIEYLNPNQ
jgi:hypothetical protein